MVKNFHPRWIRDEDAEALLGIAHVPVSPIFIMGLHRSGTTFLYQCLAGSFPLASLTLHDLLFYPRLLSRHASSAPDQDRQLLQAWMNAQTVTTRGIDDIRMTPDMVEEYGFLLQRFSGQSVLVKSNQPLFEGMCRKLQYLNPGSKGVLLKNPLDTGNGPRIHRFYPQARFIFIARDPLQILQSQYNNALHFATDPPPLLDILLQKFPLARIGVLRYRMLLRLVGKSRFGRLTVPGLMRSVVRELEAYRASYAGLPDSVKIEVTYHELIKQPRQTLDRIGAFLGLGARLDAFDAKVRPRSGRTIPEIESVRLRFAEMLRKRDLPAISPQD